MERFGLAGEALVGPGDFICRTRLSFRSQPREHNHRACQEAVLGDYHLLRIDLYLYCPCVTSGGLGHLKCEDLAAEGHP